MTMKLKVATVNGKTYAEVGANGHPMYEENGSDFEFDAQSAKDRIHTTNEEAKNHRLKSKELEEKLKAFEGLDPEQAKKDRMAVKDIDLSKLKTPDEIERAKKALTDSFEAQLKSTNESWQKKLSEKDNVITDQETNIRKLLIGNSFAGSKIVSDSLNIPADIAENFFGKNFKVEKDSSGNLKVVGYNSNGDKIYSRTSPGVDAGFDEALQILVDAYPNKDKILKGSPDGSGSKGSPAFKGKAGTVKGKDVLKLSLSEFEKADAEGKIAVE